MLEVIALWFLTKDIGKKALLKGQKPGKWKLITILAWFGAELFGFLIAVQIFGTGNIIGLFLIAMMCAVAVSYTHLDVYKRQGSCLHEPFFKTPPVNLSQNQISS